MSDQWSAEVLLARGDSAAIALAAFYVCSVPTERYRCVCVCEEFGVQFSLNSLFICSIQGIKQQQQKAIDVTILFNYYFYSSSIFFYCS
eukprot:gene12361-8488_t